MTLFFKCRNWIRGIIFNDSLTDSGRSSTSSGSLKSVTIVKSVDRSNGQLFFRHAICTSAVRKLSGTWSPESHITSGSPDDDQYLYWLHRRFKCSIQLASDLHVSGASLRQSSGIWLLKSDNAMPSKTASMPISPASAFRSRLRVRSIRVTSRLKRSSSCKRTINVGVMFMAKDFLIFQISNERGSFFKISSATLSMNWSRVVPPAVCPEFFI